MSELAGALIGLGIAIVIIAISEAVLFHVRRGRTGRRGLTDAEIVDNLKPHTSCVKKFRT